MAINIDDEFGEWFDTTINANQYEAEKYMDNILAALLVIVLDLKKTIIGEIKKYKDSITVDDMNLPELDMDDETYHEYVAKNYDKIREHLKVIDKINKEIDKFSEAMKGSLAEQIEFLSQYQYGLNAESMWLAGLIVTIPGLTARQIKEIVEYQYDPDDSGLDKYDRIDKSSNKLKEKIALLLITAAIINKPMSEYIKEIEVLFPGDENIGSYLRDLNALTVTELQVASMIALMTFIWQNRSMMQGVEYSAIWDNRICDICAGYGTDFAGIVFPIGQTPVELPQHCRCRCFWLPVLLPWYEIMNLYGVSEALFPNKIQVSSNQQMGTKLAALKKRYNKWNTVRIEKRGITVKEYPPDYFREWLFKKDAIAYTIMGKWADNYRGQFTKLSQKYRI